MDKQTYLEFKAELLKTLIQTDGLGLLDSGIFENYETRVWKQALSQDQNLQVSRLAKDALMDIFRPERRDMHFKQIMLDDSTQINVLQYTSLSASKFPSNPIKRDIGYYEEKLQRLERQHELLKVQHERQFIYFQNALIQSRSPMHDPNNQEPQEPEGDRLSSSYSVSSPNKQGRKDDSLQENTHCQTRVLKQDIETEQADSDEGLSMNLPLAFKPNSRPTRKYPQQLQDVSAIEVNQQCHFALAPFDEDSSAAEPCDRFEQFADSLCQAYSQHIPKHILVSLLDRVRFFFSTQNDKIIQTLSQKHNNTSFCMCSGEPSSQSYSTRRNINNTVHSNEEKQIGKRELMLIIREKDLIEKKKQLQDEMQDVEKQKSSFQKEMKRMTKELEASQMLIAELKQQLQGEKGLHSRLQLLHEKVDFERVKREALLKLDKENIIYESLCRLHDNLKVRNEEINKPSL